MLCGWQRQTLINTHFIYHSAPQASFSITLFHRSFFPSLCSIRQVLEDVFLLYGGAGETGRQSPHVKTTEPGGQGRRMCCNSTISYKYHSIRLPYSKSSLALAIFIIFPRPNKDDYNTCLLQPSCLPPREHHTAQGQAHLQCSAVQCSAVQCKEPIEVYCSIQCSPVQTSVLQSFFTMNHSLQ